MIVRVHVLLHMGRSEAQQPDCSGDADAALKHHRWHAMADTSLETRSVRQVPIERPPHTAPARLLQPTLFMRKESYNAKCKHMGDHMVNSVLTCLQ